MEKLTEMSEIYDLWGIIVIACLLCLAYPSILSSLGMDDEAEEWETFHWGFGK